MVNTESSVKPFGFHSEDIVYTTSCSTILSIIGSVISILIMKRYRVTTLELSFFFFLEIQIDYWNPHFFWSIINIYSIPYTLLRESLAFNTL